MEKGGKFFQDLEGLEKTPKSVGITGLWRRCDYWVVALLEKYGDAGKFWKSWEILGGMGDFGRDGKFWEGWEILGGVGDFGRVGEVAEG
jgi:hypothetical protein